MSQLLDDEDLRPHRGERELTLSTGAILGIFFGLVLLCALFFGFGYNMGRRTTPAIASSDSAYEGGAPSNPAFNGSKPSAGSPAGMPTITPTPQNQTASAGEVLGAPATRATEAATPAQAETTTPTARTAAPVETTLPVRVERPVPPASGSFSSGNFVVQVAAVSHQEDADLLVSALQRKGYSVAARNESSDKLVHIQVGPFGDHKDAEAMKQRLINDGYNALIKQL